MKTVISQKDWAKRAREVLPAGGFGNYDPSLFIASGKGARIQDEDGKEYIDYLIGSGPMILGHGHPEVLEAVYQQLPSGMTFFANNSKAIELAEVICEAVACAEQLRFLSSGGEADMYAMRLARAFTGREKILKFEGGYHGMSAEAQMSLAPRKFLNFPEAEPDSAGIPDALAHSMIIAPFNDIACLESLLEEYGQEIAGIIIEPLQRIVPPLPGFLEKVRALCDAHGIVLIFDEVVTCFRFGFGGAQEFYGVTPDLVTLGKIIGGGFPLAAVAGRRDIMAHFDVNEVGRDGWLMMLGTLSGNPVAAAAGLKTIEVLKRKGAYETLYKSGQRLQAMLAKSLNKAGIAFQMVGHETLFDVVFSEKKVMNYRDVFYSDRARAGRFNRALRDEGVFKAGGKIYACLALEEADFEETEKAIEKAVSAIVEEAD